MRPPPSVLRLFEDLDVEGLSTPQGENLLIGRLLEDGDSNDIRWLFASLGQPRILRWFETRGGRQLSKRSRAFWYALFGQDSRTGEPLGEQMWPL